MRVRNRPDTPDDRQPDAAPNANEAPTVPPAGEAGGAPQRAGDPRPASPQSSAQPPDSQPRAPAQSPRSAAGSTTDMASERPSIQRIPIVEGRPVVLGSAPDATVVIDDPQVAPHQAQLTADANGSVEITDLANGGALVNGLPVRHAALLPGAEVRVGPRRFVFNNGTLTPYDEANEVRVDAVGLRQTVHSGGPLGSRKVLLDDVSLTLLPGTFVAIVGASGSGKTTLLRALSGQTPTSGGRVLYNGRNLLGYRQDSSTTIGYVPQDDIVHKNLAVERALYYAGRLRLPKGTTRRQIWERVHQVLEDVELTGQSHQLIAQLSGGQRKRVNIALELLGKPAIFYLDEPTSGLDPGLDLKLMQLLRRLADRGQTIVLVTHATNNVDLCDYVCFLAGNGRLVYYGPPDRLKQYFHTANYAEIYNALSEDPDHWAALFRQSPDYLQYVEGPRLQSENLVRSEPAQEAAAPAAERAGSIGAVRQFFVLTHRYLDVLTHDPINLLILLAQAPIIGGLVTILAEKNVLHDVSAPPNPAVHLDFFAQRTLFIMVCSAIWFGIINAAREIVKEEAIYRRERAVNLRIVPYVLSKVVVLGGLCALQAFVLLWIVGTKTGYPTRGLFWPGTRGAFAELFISLLLVALAGLMLGLLVSALAPTTDRALSLVPIILIPQIIFSNVIFNLSDPLAKWISYFMPSRWGMQATGSIARLSDKFAQMSIPFYYADQRHLLGFWAALVGLALLFFALTLFFLKAKDAQR